MFRDEDLDVYNIQEKPDRKWKTSLIAPFGCNIIVVVYDCDCATFRVSIFINEIPLKMVLRNGHTCVKCPVSAVYRLIRSYFKDEYVPESSSSSESSSKKKKISDWALKQKLEKETS